MRLPIRYKIILPFAVLLAFVGVIGSGVATARLTDAAAAKFDADLLHSSLLANQSVAQVEAARLENLRLATDTVGVPESLAANDLDGLLGLLTPIAGNVTTVKLQLRVPDLHGTEILRIQGSRDGPARVAVTDASEFAAEPAVIKVLAGVHDTPAGDPAALFFERLAAHALLGPGGAWVPPAKPRRPPGRRGAPPDRR